MLYLSLFLMYCYGLYIGSSYFKLAIIGLLIFIIIFLIEAFRNGKIVAPVGYMGFVVAYATIILSCFVTQTYSITALIGYFVLFIITPIATSNVWARVSLNKCATILVFVACIVGVVSLADYLFGWLQVLTTVTPISKAKPPTATMYGISRLYSVSSEPTILAISLVAVVPVQLWWRKHCKVGLTHAMLMFLPAWIALALTFSTAGVIELSVAVMIITLSGKLAINIKKYVFLFAILIALTFLLQHLNIIGAFYDVAYSKLSFTNGSSIARLTRWRSALLGIVNRPLLGYGPGADLSATGGSAINWYLTFLYQCGLIASISTFVGLAGPVYKNIVRQHKLDKKSAEFDWHVACLASWCSCLVYLFSGTVIQNPIIWVIFGLGYAGVSANRTLFRSQSASKLLIAR